ncbi:MAG: hypothetical protein ABI425_04055 [Patescibacteria group bacterium]
MKKFIFLPLWFICSLAFAGSCIMGIQKLRHPQAAQIVHPAISDAVLDANSPLPQGEVKGLTTVVELADARPEIITRFLKRYDSPLKPFDEYGNKLVEIADKYNLDYRLLPAIAMQESNLCKRIPSNSFNCLGFGVTSTSTLRFESYEQAFDKAASSLKRNYVDKGLDTPEKIMSKYTPSSNGSWANSVNRWIWEMEYDNKEIGRDATQEANLVEYTPQ